MQTPRFSLEDKTWWKASVKLSSWAGFQARGGAYGSSSSAQPSSGVVQVCFAPEGRGSEPLAEGELSSINWFFANEPEVSAAVQQTILDAYPEIQEQFGFETDDGTEMQNANSIEDLKGLVGLHSVNIHQISRNGIPYIGFELGCDWDGEHGLGVLMHGTRMVEVGGADTAILLWMARQHAEESEGQP
ncbi:hypothetical protein IQ254_23070 [Nodosilinea sp. LEGE 07088]|uniref:DUF6985 domain-containing protein n=1 Tax=Nodosilinea sp. LEGE 07088 TaxID=2777968 RepID=UPI00187F2AD2|nr:hypothetical protein [Nodosilinea sp. LEGE 07088]MBE9140043.1 hypothetical protein [Nodosilinea sp. LEGE 07088]